MIEDFIIRAKLDGLSLGLSKAEVRRRLGAPEACSESSLKTEIWRYGNLEIAFNKDSLFFIGLYFDKGTAVIPSALLKVGMARSENRRRQDFERFLLANKIDFTIDQNLTFDEQVYIRLTASQLGICFVQDELHSIQVTA
jgi:hypothetical protein